MEPDSDRLNISAFSFSPPFLVNSNTYYIHCGKNEWSQTIVLDTGVDCHLLFCTRRVRFLFRITMRLCFKSTLRTEEEDLSSDERQLRIRPEFPIWPIVYALHKIRNEFYSFQKPRLKFQTIQISLCRVRRFSISLSLALSCLSLVDRWGSHWTARYKLSLDLWLLVYFH